MAESAVSDPVLQAATIRRLLNAVLGILVLTIAIHGPDAIAGPLSPVGEPLENTVSTAGQTVQNVGETVSRTANMPGLPPLGSTIQNSNSLPSPDRLGDDIRQPLGTLTAQPPSSAGPAQSSNHAREEFRPRDAFYPYTPDMLPEGTLARIYFQPGETVLDLSARNQVAGFVNAFAKRVGNVEVRGHADRSRGGDATAADIAMQRALAVQQALIDQGMSTGRVRASGMGNIDSTMAAADRVDILFDGY